MPESTDFADAAFIGDSRTEGLMLYSGIGEVDKYTSIGISIFKLESKKATLISSMSKRMFVLFSMEKSMKK